MRLCGARFRASERVCNSVVLGASAARFAASCAPAFRPCAQRVRELCWPRARREREREEGASPSCFSEERALGRRGGARFRSPRSRPRCEGAQTLRPDSGRAAPRVDANPRSLPSRVRAPRSAKVVGGKAFFFFTGVQKRSLSPSTLAERGARTRDGRDLGLASTRGAALPLSGREVWAPSQRGRDRGERNRAPPRLPGADRRTLEVRMSITRPSKAAATRSFREIFTCRLRCRVPRVLVLVPAKYGRLAGLGRGATAAPTCSPSSTRNRDGALGNENYFLNFDRRWGTNP